MYETQGKGVQGKTMYDCRVCTVLAVTGYRMAKIFHMNPYLILTTGIKLDLKQCMSFAPLYNFIASHGKIAFFRIVSRIHLILRIFCKIAFYNTAILFYNTFNHGHISTVKHHIVPIMLHGVLGLLCFGHHHKA